MHDVSTQPVAMICIDEIWLATAPLDMRAGPDTALARVVQVFGSAKPHYGLPTVSTDIYVGQGFPIFSKPADKTALRPSLAEFMVTDI